MGLREISRLIKIGHDVTNGSSAEVVFALLRNCTRSYRFSVLDVGLDDGMQNVLFAVSHFLGPTDLIIKGLSLVVKRLLRLCGGPRCAEPGFSDCPGQKIGRHRAGPE